MIHVGLLLNIGLWGSSKLLYVAKMHSFFTVVYPYSGPLYNNGFISFVAGGHLTCLQFRAIMDKPAMPFIGPWPPVSPLSLLLAQATKLISSKNKVPIIWLLQHIHCQWLLTGFLNKLTSSFQHPISPATIFDSFSSLYGPLCQPCLHSLSQILTIAQAHPSEALILSLGTFVLQWLKPWMPLSYYIHFACGKHPQAARLL